MTLTVHMTTIRLTEHTEDVVEDIADTNVEEDSEIHEIREAPKSTTEMAIGVILTEEVSAADTVETEATKNIVKSDAMSARSPDVGQINTVSRNNSKHFPDSVNMPKTQ
jgi:hypothetical protein